MNMFVQPNIAFKLTMYNTVCMSRNIVTHLRMYPLMKIELSNQMLRIF